jgi:hypothetical protein
LYPSILSIMFCLLTFLDDFRGAKVSCRWGPELKVMAVFNEYLNYH